MRKKRLIFLIIILFIVASYFFFAGKFGSQPLKEVSGIQKNNNHYLGERIIYSVRLKKLTLGEAEFENLAITELNGKLANLIAFKTRLARFKDLERIYSDPDTLLPLRIEREIKTWPIREIIIEEYDQANFSLNIMKKRGLIKNHRVIKKDGPIHNAILLPFCIRNAPNLDIGWTFAAKLPQHDFQVRLVAIEEIEVPAGRFKAFRFESSPKKFKIWISADERRIPIRIKGAQRFGYELAMKEYAPEN